jgi:Na+-transporting NADH:ubiquinone oxidoreductase subunit NqrF
MKYTLAALVATVTAADADMSDNYYNDWEALWKKYSNDNGEMER